MAKHISEAPIAISGTTVTCPPVRQYSATSACTATLAGRRWTTMAAAQVFDLIEEVGSPWYSDKSGELVLGEIGTPASWPRLLRHCFPMPV